MSRLCGPACECRQDLDSALVALDQSSSLLASTLTFADSLELIETRYAEVRAATVKLKGAMRAFADHLASPAAAISG